MRPFDLLFIHKQKIHVIKLNVLLDTKKMCIYSLHKEINHYLSTDIILKKNDISSVCSMSQMWSFLWSKIRNKNVILYRLIYVQCL